MKRASLIALFFVPLALQGQQTPWQWVNPTPQGNVLNGIWAVSQATAVAVGAFGTVVRTTNGGRTWQVEAEIGGITDQFLATQFISGTTGWTVGEFGVILKTTDGGESWYPQTTPTIKDLFAVNFVSATTGWAAGTEGTMLKTTNGGTTWVAESTHVTVTLYGMNFISATTGFAVGGNGTLLATTNGGTSWSPRTSGTTQTLYGIQFVSSFIGYAVGSAGVILKTANGGTSWTPQSSGTDLSLFGVQFTTSLIGWAFGSYGTLVKTTNGGTSWFPQNSGTYNDLFGMRFVSSSVGWGVGDLGIMVATTDGGTTWALQSSGVKNTLDGVFFVSTTDGFAVGEGGTIIKTDDGGLTWVSQPSPVFQTLFGVYMVTPSLGYAVGDSAVIVKTTTGGTLWVEQNSHSSPSLYSVNFVSATVGWAVGDFGTILKTTNGGSWVAQTNPTTNSLTKVRFLNSSVGWAVGYSGTILKTTNGGTAWVKQTSNTTHTLNDLEVIDANSVCAVGDFGTILKTTNGGTTWFQEPSSPVSFFYGVTFSSSATGWVSVDDGTVLKTTDGGSSWVTQMTPTQNTLWDIQFIPGRSGGIIYAVGAGGTVVCSAVTPLPVRTWTGSLDSLWTSAGNWNPVGAPEKLDSVYIPSTTLRPVISATTQQVNIGALRIAPGATLKVGSGLAQLIIKNSVTVDGALSLDPGSTLQIIASGSFLVSASGSFTPASSTVILGNQGQVRGNFHSLFIGDGASIQTLGNVSIEKGITLLSTLSQRPVDTLILQNSEAQAFQGPGIVTAGSIRRAIQPSSTDFYRFESPVTYVRFLSQGTLPGWLTMTVRPNTLPIDLSDTLFVRRTYEVIPSGGSNYSASISLRYDPGETAMSIDTLSLFRDSSGILKNIGRSDFLDSDLVAISLDTLTRFSTMYIGSIDYFPLHPMQFTDTLTVTDHGAISAQLSLGATPEATDSIDSDLGEVPLGPTPPSGTFDARWLIPGTQGTHVDILPVLGGDNPDNIYRLSIQPGPGGYPMALQWKSTDFPNSMVFLQDDATGGTQFNINMRVQSSYTITNPSISTVRILHKTLTTYQYSQGWNMTCYPLTPSFPPRKKTVFPAAISNLFGYSGSAYYIADTMKNARGYWIKFATPKTIGIEGVTRALDTVKLNTGWNLIGGISNPVAVTAIVQNPPGTVVSRYFGYAGSYSFTDSLRPSKGYWVKSSGAGTLVLSSSTALPKAQASDDADFSAMNSVTITDREGGSQTLYFSTSGFRNSGSDLFSLPPPPPPGVFDARFISNSFAEELGAGNLTFTIQSSAYPVTIGWNLVEPGLRGIHFADAASKTKIIPAAGGGRTGSVTISDPSVTLLSLGGDKGPEVPREFSLHQNYPNPFNPSTTLSFDLPVRSRVTLRVFNLLGQQVALLADNQPYDGGTFSLSFTPASLASGVYFYELVATSEANHAQYRQVKKMVLLR